MRLFCRRSTALRRYFPVLSLLHWQVPWGNARRNSDGSVTCQHGPDECHFNIVEGCVVHHYPDTKQVHVWS